MPTKLIGTTVDVFHKDPSHQRRMVEGLMSTHRTAIEVASRTFGLIASPITDENGGRLGTVVEWEDRTERLAFERDEKRKAEENLRIKVRPWTTARPTSWSPTTTCRSST